MTLREIIWKYPEMFYQPQVWYLRESFVDREAKEISVPSFEQWSFPYLFPKQQDQRVSAADLCLSYVNNPTAPVWDNYLWTDDVDSQNQRVYVGGKSNTGAFEIHRHLTITSRFGLPVFSE